MEDCEPVAQLLATNLSEHFREIRLVTTLTAARRQFRRVDGAPFDFVICSLTLPDGSGMELQQWLDEYLTPRRLPFVLLAGSLPGLRRPPSEVVILPKPCQVGELLGALKTARSRAIQARPPANSRVGTPPLCIPRARLTTTLL